jgi:hypothetical protein
LFEALKQGFFAIDVSNYQVLWSVSFVRESVKRRVSRKMVFKSFIAGLARNISKAVINI